jgi:hypothetical protein
MFGGEQKTTYLCNRKRETTTFTNRSLKYLHTSEKLHKVHDVRLYVGSVMQWQP